MKEQLKASDSQSRSFLKGTLVLGTSMVVVKVIGMIYKILLANIFGGLGNGIFNVTYELYNPLFTLATAGFPIAISRMVSESVASGRYRDVRKIHQVSIPFFVTTGLFCFLLMVVACPIYVSIIDAPDAKISIFCLAPTILFGCLMSIYRGYYEGLQNMYPTAISEIIEASCKLIVGLSLAYITIAYGQNQYENYGKVFGQEFATEAEATNHIISYAVGAAIIGITLGSVFGFIFLLLRHKIKGDGISRRDLYFAPPSSTGKETMRRLFKTALPIGLGAIIMSVAGAVDASLVNVRIKNIMQTVPDKLLGVYGSLIPTEIVSAGSTHLYLYGCYSYALTVMMLITAVTQVFGQSALPSVTRAYTAGDKRMLKNSIESVLRITTMFTFPAGLGICVLSKPILQLLYSSSVSSEIEIASRVLQVMGIAVIFIATSTPLCSMLQAIGRVDLPVKLYGIGMVIKIVLNYILVGIPAINIQGASTGSLVCYAFVCFTAVYYICKETKIIPNLVTIVIKPLLAAIGCAVTAWGVYKLTSLFIPDKLSTIFAVLCGATVYFIVLVICKGIRKRDIIMLPKGNKIVKALEKHHLIR